jgi:hypothetical protein
MLEAQALAERLDDDHRRGLVYACMTSHQASNAPSEALVVGGRALGIAECQGDLGLRIVTTNYLEQAHFWRGDYEKVVALATENLATLPPIGWVHDPLWPAFTAVGSCRGQLKNDQSVRPNDPPSLLARADEIIQVNWQ